MHDRKSISAAQSSSSQRMKELRTPRPTGQLNGQLPQYDSQGQGISQVSSFHCLNVYLDSLNQRTIAKPTLEQRSLLQLQRLYGNRYTRQVLTLSRRIAAKGGEPPDLEKTLEEARHLSHEDKESFQPKALPRLNPTNFNLLQKGPPVTEAGRYAQNIARGDQSYLRTQVVSALRATGNPIQVNTADAITNGVISLDVITRHPEPERHASGVTAGGTYFFPGTDLNRVLQSHISTSGAANIPGMPSNVIYLLVRLHFSHPRRAPSFFFRAIVHEAQHYFDRHTHEAPSPGVDSDIFDVWLSYKTEFNAYWADGRFDFYPVTGVGAGASGPRQLRWEAIRDFLMGQRPYRSQFRWLWAPTQPPAPTGSGAARRIAAWRYRMYPRFHQWFRRQVDAYHEPEVFNRLNSPRIDQFYQALRSGPTGRPVRVRSALAALNPADIAEIRASTRFQQLIRQRLRRNRRLLREVWSRIGFTGAIP